MKKFFKNILDNLVATFNTQPGGFSARKLTAFITMVSIIYLHISYVDTINVVSVLAYDMLFVLLLFGIVTFDQLYKFKNNQSDTNIPPKPDPEKEKIDKEDKNLG